MSNRSFAIIALSIWLILTGLFSLTNLQVQFAPVIMAVLAIVAGLLLLLGR